MHVTLVNKTTGKRSKINMHLLVQSVCYIMVVCLTCRVVVSVCEYGYISNACRSDKVTNQLERYSIIM